MNVNINSVRSLDEELQILETSFLDERAKRVIRVVWIELLTQLVALRSAFRTKDTT